MGDVVMAVDDYKSIPEPVRARLKQRMAARQYDEMVTIERDRISGKHAYNPAIRDMHFGSSGRVCKTVSRTAWTAKNQERGLVYCESGQCILVPTVCRNVSRITRLPERKAAEPEAAAGDTGAGEDPVVAAAPENGGGGGGSSPSNDGRSFAQESKPGGELPPLTGDGGEVFPPIGRPLPPTTLPPIFLPPILIPPAPPYPPIPEPGTWALMVIGLVVLVARRRSLQRRA